MGCTPNDYEPIGNKIYVVGNTNPISNKVMLSELRNGMRPYSSNTVNTSAIYSGNGQSHANYQMSGLTYGIEQLSKNLKGIDSKVYEVGQKVSDVSKKIVDLDLSNILLTEHVGRLEELLEKLTENMNPYSSRRVSSKAYPIVYDGLAAVVEELHDNVIHVDFSKKEKKGKKAA